MAHVFCRTLNFLPLIYGCMLISPQAVSRWVEYMQVLYKCFAYTGKEIIFSIQSLRVAPYTKLHIVHGAYSLFYMHVIYIFLTLILCKLKWYLMFVLNKMRDACCIFFKTNNNLAFLSGGGTRERRNSTFDTLVFCFYIHQQQHSVIIYICTMSLNWII